MQKIKFLRITTIPLSLTLLLKGQLKFLTQNGFDVFTASSDGDEINDLYKNENITHHFNLPLTRQISLFTDIYALISCYILLRKVRPDIIHSNTPKAGLISMTAAFFAGTPIRIHTFTGLIFPYRTGLFQKILILMDKIVCRFATHIFPEGEGVRNDLIKYNITNKPLKIIANGNLNGIDLDFFNPEKISKVESKALQESLNISKEDLVFIYIGRLVKDKGINELVEAFKKICCNDARVKLLLVGHFETDLDPLRAETMDEISNNQNIIYTGFQKDVRPYLSISDVFIFPSYREGFPNVVLQAGAMGLPSIVTDISGCNEIIVNQRNGIIIPSKDTEAIINVMRLFLTDGNLVSKLREEARSMIASRFDQKVVWEALLVEYRKIINENK